METEKERVHIQRIGIINTWDQHIMMGGERVVIFKQNQDTGRGGSPAAWQVGYFKNGKLIPTNPKAHWADYGKKTFVIFGRSDREARFQEALAWVAEKYGPRDFVRNRMGDYVEREVNEKFPIPKRTK